MNQPGTTFAFDAYSTEIAVDPYSAYAVASDELSSKINPAFRGVKTLPVVLQP
jgi:hypothetical protein